MTLSSPRELTPKSVGAQMDAYTRDLTKALRPKYGRDYAPLLAEAFVDFTNDRPGDALGGDERLAYRAEARARFYQRAGRIKAAWAKGESDAAS